MSQPRIGVVFNPNSKRNRLQPERFGLLQELVGDQGIVCRTAHPDDVPAVIGDFLDTDVRWWVADGGDGAFHWLVNKADQVIVERNRGERIPAILPTNNGTINFVGTKAGVIGRGEPLIRALVDLVAGGGEPKVVEVDSLRMRGVYNESSEFPGEEFDKVGFACAAAGVSQRFFDKFYAHGRLDALGISQVIGQIIGSAFLGIPGVKSLPLPTDAKAYSDSIFEPQGLDVWIDGEQLPLRWFTELSVGSIDLDIAGIFQLFPYAREPGVMHVQAGAPTIAEVVLNLPRIAAGTDLRMANMVQQPAREMRVVARDTYAIDPCIDGELFYGLQQLTVSKGPAVQVICISAPTP